MKPTTLTAAAVIAVAGIGCASGKASYVRSETVLGRVVIYRNGVAYFERSATVADDTLRLSVPAERVDDFLRSLTVINADTGQPAPVAYPTAAARLGGSNLIDMKIGLSGAAPHRQKLSYVTEAPSWNLAPLTVIVTCPLSPIWPGVTLLMAKGTISAPRV